MDLRACRDRGAARVHDADEEVGRAPCGFAEVGAAAVDVEVDSEGVRGGGGEEEAGWGAGGATRVCGDEGEEAEDIGVGSVKAGFDEGAECELFGGYRVCRMG